MTSTPREIGTLIVVILKAKHLPNKRHIGKQDPYCVALMNGEKRRTKAIKRGGQHPEWDEEVRFTLLQDTDNDLPASNDQSTPPLLPAKDDKTLNIKGGKIMKLSCFADDPREPDLIGEANVDLTEVLTRGETDEWFTLRNKDKFSGEVYLELTFWSNEPVPVKKPVTSAPKANEQYAGPGSFTPSSDDSSRSSLASSTHSLRHPSSSSVYEHGQYSLDSIPRPSSSMAQLDLYVAPYDQRRSVDHLASEFSEFGVSEPRRRESLPAPPSSYNTRPMSSTASFSTISSRQSQGTQGYEQASYHAPYAYDDRPNGLDRASSLSSLHSSYSVQAPYQQPQYAYEDHNQGQYRSEYLPSEYQPAPAPSRGPRYSVPTTSSGFVPLQTSTLAPIPSQSVGFVQSQSYHNGQSAYSHSHVSQYPSGFPADSLQTATPSSFSQPPPASSFHLQQQFTASPAPYPYSVPPPPPLQNTNIPNNNNNNNNIGSRPLPPQPQQQNYGQGQQNGNHVQSYSPTSAHVPSSSIDLYARSRRVSLPQPPSNFYSVGPPPPLPVDYQQYNNVPSPPSLPAQQQPFFPGPPPRPPAQLINNDQQQWQQQHIADYPQRWS